MASVERLSDVELRRRLLSYGLEVGPVTDTTRRIYEKKLEKLTADDNISTEDLESSKTTKSRRSLSRGSSGNSFAERSSRLSKSDSGYADEISDAELRTKLLEYGVSIGPVTPTTKVIYVKKLQKLTAHPEEQRNGPSAGGKGKLRPSLMRASSDESDTDESANKSMPPPSSVPWSQPRTVGRISDGSRVSIPLDGPITDPEPTWKRGSLYPDLGMNSSVGKAGSVITSRTSMLDRSAARFSSGTTSPHDRHSRNDDFDTGSDSDAPGPSYSESRKYDFGSRVSPPRSSFLGSLSSVTSKFSSAFSSADNHGYSSAKDRLSAARRFGVDDAASSARSSGFKDSGNSGYASAYTQRLAAQLNSRQGGATSRYSSGSTSFYSSPVSVNDVKERDVGEETRSVVGSPSSLYGTRSFSFTRRPRELSQEFRTEDMIRSWYNSQVVSWVLLCLALLFFVLLAVIYMGVRSSDAVDFYEQEGNTYPVCRDGISVTPCIHQENLRNAVQAARLLLDELTQRAVNAQCKRTSKTALMSHEEAVLWLDKNEHSGHDVQAMLRNVKILYLSNSQWGVDLLPVGRSDAIRLDQLEDQRNLLAFGGLVVCDPPLPLGCYLWQKLSSLVFYAVILVFGALVLYGGKWLGSWYLSHLRNKQKAVHDMVQRILTLLEANHKSGGQSYLAINHVRDQLIQPWDRDKLAWVWDEAVKFLEQRESRVRCEVQQVAGEEFRVWRWLPSYGRSTPSSTSSTPDQGQALKQNKVWQGQAFETMKGSPNSLMCSPTPCLKIRHMFDVEIEYGDEWPVRIRDAILEKCEGVHILHISVDRQSREGCVYVKCLSQQDAGKAYQLLHGSWFDGKLVTVKYLRVERYHERFPDAVRAVTPLKPSNNKKLSLQSRQETI